MRSSLVLLLALVAAACLPPVSSTESLVPMSDAIPHASDWRQHDTTRPAPDRAEPAPSRLPTPAPADATVLIPADGGSTEAFRATWESPGGNVPPWVVEDGAVVVVPGSGPIQTRRSFGDLQLHIEWQAADEPEKTSQDRSNSGVFLLDGRYEVQILDTYDNATYPDGMAGAIYGQYPPLANALRPSNEWQSYDLFFRSPRFSDDGTVLEPARLTVLINGVLVQNNELLPGMTIWMQSLPYELHPSTGAIQLQDHGSPVRFRNLWVRETPARPVPPAGYADIAAVDVSEVDLARLVGRYERGPGDLFVIEDTPDGLALSMPWRSGLLPMVPLSPTRFQLQHTAAVLTFGLDADSQPTGLVVEMGGGTYPATRVVE
ncbi:MAG: DUF1080 domain-containing protein [Bacteroidota bacterium]